MTENKAQVRRFYCLSGSRLHSRSGLPLERTVEKKNSQIQAVLGRLLHDT